MTNNYKTFYFYSFTKLRILNDIIISIDRNDEKTETYGQKQLT